MRKTCLIIIASLLAPISVVNAAPNPEMIVVCYPGGSVNAKDANGAMSSMLRVVERLQVTSIVVTHDMRSARRVAGRILMLHAGKIYASGTPDEIFRSQDPIIHRFVNGISEIKEHRF